MQMGPYIPQRLMPKIIAAYCARTGIDFQSFSEDWVLRLARGDRVRWVVGTKFDLNGSAVGEVAQDKVATYAVLAAAKIPAIPHYLVRSLPHELIHVRELHELLGDAPVVAKPLEGTGGRFVVRFVAATEALEMMRHSGEPAWAISPHYDLQAEYRLIMLDGKLLRAYEKTQPTLRGELKLFNLGFGAVAVDLADDMVERLLPITQNVMRATALRLAAVDVVRLSDDSLAVLEVNDGITMEHYARQSPENEQRTAQVYEAIVAAMLPSQ